MIWQQIINDFSAAQVAMPKAAPSTKVCMDCKQDLPLEKFYFRKGHGYKSRCKSCFMKREKRRKQCLITKSSKPSPSLASY